ncbi:MAG: hypothetical protein E7Z87_05780 [Cyanobacteria bacterium SIG26]|nr:hypothetical protein [Cyanobacteria bacterium SIG26]
MNFNCFNNLSSVNVFAAKSYNASRTQLSAPSFTGEDTFVKSSNSDEIYVKKMNELFPNGSLDKIYAAMNKEFGIDIPAKLKLYGTSDGVQAGGYTYSKNEIGMSMQEFIENDHKVVGIKDGKKFTIMSPKINLPMFASKDLCNSFLNMPNNPYKMFFDKFEVVPISKDEQRKFILQRIVHEVIHAQQHMIMRQTSDIGELEVLKAWSHYIPNTQSDAEKFDNSAKEHIKKTFWGTQPPTSRLIAEDSQLGQLAHVWLEAVRYYPPVDSPEYNKNAIEVDAYNRSYDYIVKRFGKY